MERPPAPRVRAAFPRPWAAGPPPASCRACSAGSSVARVRAV